MSYDANIIYMRICFIPIDNRPVCYSLAKDICAINEDIEIFIPPRDLFGSLTKYANTNAIFDWLYHLPRIDSMILSLDTLAYGGLIPSRRVNNSFEEIKKRIERLKPIIADKKVYAFSSIMRISNNNYNEEEKEYWNDWGKKIFEYSYNSTKYWHNPKTDIPQDILQDYLSTRKRNFEINKMYLEWQNEGFFDTLIFSKDDCAEFGFNVEEAKELERLGGKTKTGADEIPLTLLARAVKKDINIYPLYTEPKYIDCISNYEDVSIEKSVLGQLELGGFNVVKSEKDADIVLVVNNFIEKQGELVMGWTTQPFNRTFIPPTKPYAIADVRYANGADNGLVSQLFNSDLSLPEYGYAGWNTSANTLGSLLAAIKVKFNAAKYNDRAYKKLQIIRYLDDWAYQANVRAEIEEPCDIKELMKPYEEMIFKKVEFASSTNNENYISPQYTYPWGRKFEVEVKID